MKNESKSIIIMCFYVIVMIGILVLSVYLLNGSREKDQINNDLNFHTTDVTETRVIYVPIYFEETVKTEEESTSTSQIKYFTVKNYGQKIGVFNEEQTLVSVIEVYTKTLPKADRDLLEKGMVVFSEDELRRIVEDYTG